VFTSKQQTAYNTCYQQVNAIYGKHNQTLHSHTTDLKIIQVNVFIQVRTVTGAERASLSKWVIIHKQRFHFQF